jgi:hypothetical protein
MFPAYLLQGELLLNHFGVNIVDELSGYGNPGQRTVSLTVCRLKRLPPFSNSVYRLVCVQGDSFPANNVRTSCKGELLLNHFGVAAGDELSGYGNPGQRTVSLTVCRLKRLPPFANSVYRLVSVQGNPFPANHDSCVPPVKGRVALPQLGNSTGLKAKTISHFD